jgi:hypothetical protein
LQQTVQRLTLADCRRIAESLRQIDRRDQGRWTRLAVGCAAGGNGLRLAGLQGLPGESCDFQ